MTATSSRGTAARSPHPAGQPGSSPARGPNSPAPNRQGPGAYPWAMSAAISLALIGASLSLNGVLRGWAWLLPVITTVCTVALALALLRAVRARTPLPSLGALAALTGILTFIFFRQHSLAGVVPTPDTLAEAGKLLKRATETVVSESSPVAPNAGIVLVCCTALGLLVVLVDALAVPLSMPATSGLGILAVTVVPAILKPQSVGLAGFLAAGAGYLLILACSQWFAPDSRLQSGSSRAAGQFRRSAVIGMLALGLAMTVPLAIPGFDSGTFPQGSRLAPWGTTNGLNPMITLGNSLRNPGSAGRITYATSSTSPVYLRSVTIDSFEGETWAPDDRGETRRADPGRMESGYGIQGESITTVTAVDAGQFTSPYLPSPFAPQAVSGLNGRWTWDPQTLSIMGTETTTRNQSYVVFSSMPKLSAAALVAATDPARSISEEFLRVPGNVPDVVRQTASTVTAAGGSNFAKALAIQRYLRSGVFSYSLQAPVQNGYDGNGLSVLADFLNQKSGYCVHFSSAMAVMARLEGIPSRIAVGYAPGRITGGTVAVAGAGPLPEYEVDARDAHAWPELYFEGLGWVPFEPTPSRGAVPDYAADSVSSGGAGTNENNEDLLPETRTPLPDTTALPVPPGPGPGQDGGGQPAGLLWSTAAVILSVALLCTPRLVRTGLRSRRLHPRTGKTRTGKTRTGRAARRGLRLPDPAPVLAWHELVDLSHDYGLRIIPSETPRHFSARLRGSGTLGEPGGFDDDGHAAVVSLTSELERQRYGPPADGPAVSAAERMSLVHTAMRGNAGRWTRFRADWLPPSLTQRLLHGTAAPFRAGTRLARRISDGLVRLPHLVRGLFPARR